MPNSENRNCYNREDGDYLKKIRIPVLININV